MPLSWNETKDRALRFSREWAQESSEDAEAKSFWDGFLHIFGISRRRVATFERKAPKLGTDAERVAFLFERYETLTSLLPAEKPKRGRGKAGAAQADGAA